MVIYKTTNLINGRFYVGQDVNNNPNYIGSGLLLKQSIDRYGKDNFKKEILEYCSSKEVLNEREIFWIQELKAQERGVGYNITDGGSGGDVFTNHPDKEKIREKQRISSQKSNNRPEVKEKHRVNTKKRWEDDPIYRERIISSIRSRSVESRIKLVESLKKVIHDDEWNDKVGNNNVIRFHIKKIKYFINSGMKIEVICDYFNLTKEKVISTIEKHDGFDLEPDVDTLLTAFEYFNQNLSINKIRSKMIDAPSRVQIKVFIELSNLLKI